MIYEIEYPSSKKKYKSYKKGFTRRYKKICVVELAPLRLARSKEADRMQASRA